MGGNTKDKILVVDDLYTNLEVISHILIDAGYNIALAEDGESAISILKKESFDLILLDIMMPGIDGFELCQIIRNELNINNVPIMFITAKSELSDIVQGFELGAQDYVSKPFDLRELLARVETQIELYKTKEQLRNMNQILEEKVNERTKELAKTNDELNKANKKLTKLDNAKMEFLKIISHEIRTPLNGIRGFAELIQHQNQANKLNNHIKLLIESIDRLEDFSELALDITALQLNQYQVHYVPIKIEETYNSAIENYKSLIHKKKIQVKWKAPNCNHLLYGDEILIAKAIEIIVENALKHTAPDTSISISCTDDDEYYFYKVRDEGSGFPKSLLESGIKPFYTGNRHIDMNKGLDLYFAHITFLAHNCDLEIQNSETGGGIVIIKVPKSNALAK